MAGPLLYAHLNSRVVFKLASSSDEKDAVLSLGPTEQDISIESLDSFPSRGDIRKIAALIGCIRLKHNSYAIIAHRVEEFGSLAGHKVFKVVEHTVLPLNKFAKKDKDEQHYLALLELQLSNATLFYSYTYDLTNSAQRNETLGANSWEKADTRFFWNHYATEPLRALAAKDSRAGRFIQPMIFGYAHFIDSMMQQTPITIGLVTRRSIFRAGTRYFRRGIDADGNVANFNETEQFLVVQGGAHSENLELFSFLQTRGSVPVYWGEINNLKYKPNLVVGENSSLDATAKHFNQQKDLYGDNYLVNLVNQKGHELPVKNSYESSVNALNDPKIHYVYFDFHHECRNMKWHRVKLLIDHLQKMGLDPKDVFHKIIAPNGKTIKILSEQHSVVRTNCMDCLDRTNVVQSVLAHWVLQQEFVTANVIPEDQLWEKNLKLLVQFQSFWADNADAVSFAYSGTGALKTDFTRTGNRTRVGAFNDFLNSVSRYYQNNLSDGPRQDSFDLFLGTFSPSNVEYQSPFADRRPFVIQIMPTIICAALTVIAATIFFPKGHFTSKKNLTFLFLSSAVLSLSIRFIYRNGEQFVNWPKFNDLGFLVAVQTHNKERTFKGIKYVQSPKYSKPEDSKKD
ncbi:LANO_0E16600g1_1 [Lachancea nothofagi CBS 11611]|uniref:LANO_0E16600g1_1 n=1 Tax=Lachancea nothofagi CBS 11611 TaxID=1266666 RepID=A0A1G4K2C2_9SACH|nr:LANO_0E16600g1_1 [Lachancea nothofagi CBS 11611]